MTAGRHVVSGSVDWSTPEKYVRAVKSVLGVIALDPCSNEWSIVKAKNEWRLPDNHGLAQRWDFPTIFVNPPYGADRERGARIIDWLHKCADAHEKFGFEVIALVPIAANTKHWKKYIWPKARSIAFLYDTRLKFFENGKEDGKGAPMACAMIYWGKEHRKFANVFARHGAVLSLSDIRIPDDHETSVVDLPLMKHVS